MSVQLKKGHSLRLDKESFDLSSVQIGCGWDMVPPPKPGFLKSILGQTAPPPDYDLDIAALLLNPEGFCDEPEDDFIYFGNMQRSDYSVCLSEDNRDGKGDGDDEEIQLALDALDDSVQQVVLFVCIYEAQTRGQRFGGVANAYVRAVDSAGREMVRFQLSGSQYRDACSMEFARLVRDGDTWRFHAVGRGDFRDKFGDLVAPFLR